MTTTDLTKIFSGKIEEPIGHSIEFLSVIMASNTNNIEPSIFWLKTSDGVWHRFFIDAWAPHWSFYNENEKTEIIKEELQDEVIENTRYYVKDLMEEFGLKNKKIKCIEMFYDKRDELFFGNLKINIEDSNEINIYDYGDEINAELYINNTIIQ